MSPKYKNSFTTEYSVKNISGSNCADLGIVIKSNEGQCFVIDGGAAENAERLASHIVSECDGKVDAWFVTCPRPESAGALLKILRTKSSIVKIDRVIYSHIIPDEVEKYDGTLAAFAENFNITVRSSKCRKLDVATDDRIKLGRALVRVFKASDLAEDMSADFVSNLGVAYKFTLCRTSALFLGSLGTQAGTVILENYKDELSCDYLQIPICRKHLPDGIYALANPSVCLWFVTADDWEKDAETERTRNLLTSLGVTDNRVTGLGDSIDIEITY